MTLRRSPRSFALSFARSLTCAAAVVLGALSCAHGAQEGTSARGPSSVDTRDGQGRPGTLADLGAKVIVVDICAAWSDACLVNARVLDEACQAVCGEDVALVTLLLDEPGPTAVESYRAVMGTKRPVLSPGPRTLAGQSALGGVGDAIPRLVIFAPDGSIVDDQAGGILSAHGVVKRVRELL